MSMTPNEIESQQRDSWNKFSGGWKKWDELTMRWLKPTADAMLAEVPWHPGMSILDIASGTGEPGLTAAAKVPTGHVLATDLAEHMTAIASETARARGLTNFRAQTGSVDHIAAPDNNFDVALCRYGFMFFPNVPSALAEIKRVLKPGGRLIAAVWSAPAKNAWATTMMSTLRAHVDLPVPPADAPGLFRFADVKGLADAAAHAGLHDVRVREIEWTAAYGSPQNYWNLLTEVAAPVVAGLAQATPEAREKIHAEVIAAVSRSVVDGEVRLPNGSHVLIAVK